LINLFSNTAAIATEEMAGDALCFMCKLNYHSCTVMLRYVTLCYVMLRYVTLCYVKLRYVTLCYVMLRYVTLCYNHEE